MRLTGIKQFSKRAKAVEAMARDMRSLPKRNLNTIGDKFRAVQKAHYKALKGRDQYHRSGELSASLTQKGANHIARADSGNSVTFGTRVPYAVYLGKGKSRRARAPVIRMRKSDVKRIFIKPLLRIILLRWRRAMRGRTT